MRKFLKEKVQTLWGSQEIHKEVHGRREFKSLAQGGKEQQRSLEST